MPDMEDAIMSHSEHEEASIRRHARKRGTTIQTISLEDQFTRSELICIWIERFFINIVFHLIISANHLDIMTDRIEELEMRTAVIERLAIGCPYREYFKFADFVFKISYLVLLHIIGYQVTHCIEHLNSVGIAGMETLTGLVGGIDNQREPGVPRRINASRENRVVAHIDLT